MLIRTGIGGPLEEYPLQKSERLLNNSRGDRMDLLLRLIKAVKRNPTQLLRFPGYTVQFLISNLELRMSSRMHRERPYDGTAEEIIQTLANIGYKPEVWHLQRDDYLSYCKNADYEGRKYYAVGTSFIWKKTLEHYLSTQMLKLEPDDVFIDVASDQSVLPEIVGDLYGVRGLYRQDLIYKPGIHGNTIGGNAADMSVPNGFASKLALHNSFEHFEGDSDSGFIREAARILRPGGRFVIVPIYVGLSYYYLSSYFRSRWGVPIDKDAEWCLQKGQLQLQRHCRMYDVEHLKSRVLDFCDPFEIKIFHIPNVREIHPFCDSDFALVGTKLDN